MIDRIRYTPKNRECVHRQRLGKSTIDMQKHKRWSWVTNTANIECSGDWNCPSDGDEKSLAGIGRHEVTLGNHVEQKHGDPDDDWEK